MERKRKLYIGFGALMVLLILAVVGITYGFYELKIKGNTSNYSFDLTRNGAKTMSVEFQDGIQLMSLDRGYFFPGDSKSKGFSVQNTGEEDAKYTILLDNVKNDFVRTQDLQYQLYINNELVTTGTLTNEEIQYLYYDRVVKVGTTDKVKFVLKYLTTSESQNEDMNKNLSFRFNISDKVKED